jgi:hypothetical protein
MQFIDVRVLIRPDQSEPHGVTIRIGH